MIDLATLYKSQEFKLETASNLWFVSINDVNLNEVPPPEHNPYYNLLERGIRNDQLRIEDAHLDLAEKGNVILTRLNLMKFFNASAECIPAFLLPQEYRWLVKEESPLKEWLLKILMDRKLNSKRGLLYGVARLIEKCWPNFRSA